MTAEQGSSLRSQTQGKAAPTSGALALCLVTGPAGLGSEPWALHLMTAPGSHRAGHLPMGEEPSGYPEHPSPKPHHWHSLTC